MCVCVCVFARARARVSVRACVRVCCTRTCRQRQRFALSRPNVHARVGQEAVAAIELEVGALRASVELREDRVVKAEMEAREDRECRNKHLMRYLSSKRSLKKAFFAWFYLYVLFKVCPKSPTLQPQPETRTWSRNPKPEALCPNPFATFRVSGFGFGFYPPNPNRTYPHASICVCGCVHISASAESAVTRATRREEKAMLLLVCAMEGEQPLPCQPPNPELKTQDDGPQPLRSDDIKQRRLLPTRIRCWQGTVGVSDHLSQIAK